MITSNMGSSSYYTQQPMARNLGQVAAIKPTTRNMYHNGLYEPTKGEKLKRRIMMGLITTAGLLFFGIPIAMHVFR